MPIGDKMTPGTPAGGGDGEPSVMWSNNVPLPAPGRLALIILSRVGCRQYEHVAREGGHHYPAIISQITETHNTAHNYIRPDTIISTHICFTGAQLRIFSFCLVLIHLV